jgi:hypothetical protein
MGPFKGYQGVVKTVTDKGLRVQLNTNGKVVNCLVSQVALPGQTPSHAPTANNNSFAQRAAGAQTPIGGSKTPAPGGFGDATPAWNVGSKTPAPEWGGRTPAPIHEPVWEPPREEPVRAPQEGSRPWLRVRMEVIVKEGPDKGKRGVVITIQDQGCIGMISLDVRPGQHIPIPSQFLDPVRPQKRDHCYILSSAETGTREGVWEVGQVEGDDYFVRKGEEIVNLDGKDLCRVRMSG